MFVLVVQVSEQNAQLCLAMAETRFLTQAEDYCNFLIVKIIHNFL